jgi:hypothetical protein
VGQSAVLRGLLILSIGDVMKANDKDRSMKSKEKEEDERRFS